jgi:hypothetical protein
MFEAISQEKMAVSDLSEISIRKKILKLDLK